MREWLYAVMATDLCTCVNFMPGSVTATVHVEADATFMNPSDIFSMAKSFISTSSNTDPRTNKAEATSIIIGNRSV
ncbi:hypothetical protein LSH36_1291g00044 [Paralvinella palmiformis]|uniref:Uncharacterized protein n=1 Tax=Paralvinella palmiformis TaxID=53620 RepID=A0AAD9MQQ0_9ANNE|nr:hypothetical protein LSH36_1291g00044 [Paralvinella palmiformis]